MHWFPLWIILYFKRCTAESSIGLFCICSGSFFRLFSGTCSLRLTLKTRFCSESSSTTTRFDHLRWNGKHIKARTMLSLALSSASCWKGFSQWCSPRLDWLYDQMEWTLLATEHSLSLTWLTPLCAVALSLSVDDVVVSLRAVLTPCRHAVSCPLLRGALSACDSSNE